ncbi:hypothetical protein SEA_TYPHA_43 [Mycobacterium phage Typha]|uniref:Uncharacterized protein n=1 Tax=Mycobacterium phage Typha TaxID=2517971 RepID=A0A482JAF8_9CAUD|nr:hypothetical protein KCH40_gp126 [Mycobacterium phage Typha]QBP29698.1 hypothetical protein SEA_TYPHA_43 [Mycobacterium phage Typha]
MTDQPPPLREEPEMPATVEFTAITPDGQKVTRNSKTKQYTHAVATLRVRDNDTEATWGIASFHEGVTNAFNAGRSYKNAKSYRVVEVEVTAVKGTPSPEHTFAIEHKERLAQVAEDAPVEVEDAPVEDAPVAEVEVAEVEVADQDDTTEVAEVVEVADTPQERRNRKARERRAAKRAAAASEKQAQDDAIAKSECLTVTEVEEAPKAKGRKAPRAKVTPLSEIGLTGSAILDAAVAAAADEIAEDAPVEVAEVEAQVVEVEVTEDSADTQITQVLEVTADDIAAAKAGMVKGEKCPGYGMVVPGDGASKGNGSHKRVECPVCGHSVKRYDKSGKLGSHRV